MGNKNNLRRSTVENAVTIDSILAIRDSIEQQINHMSVSPHLKNNLRTRLYGLCDSSITNESDRGKKLVRLLKDIEKG